MSSVKSDDRQTRLGVSHHLFRDGHALRRFDAMGPRGIVSRGIVLVLQEGVG